MSINFKSTSEWIKVELKRFRDQLPHELQNEHAEHAEKSTNLIKESLVKLSHNKFEDVVTALSSYIRTVGNQNTLNAEKQSLRVESNIIILQTIKQCFEKNEEQNSALSYDVVKLNLLPSLCPLIFESNSSQKLKILAGELVYLISQYHYSPVFEKISRRISWFIDNNEDSNNGDELDLIQYVHVPVEGLILLCKECSSTFKNLKRNAQTTILKGLYKAIWNWIETYPSEFTTLYKQPNKQLEDLSDSIFLLTDQFCEASKKKNTAWPLQIMLLLLSPGSIQEASGNGDVTKPIIKTKRSFLEHLKKSLGSSRASSEYALLALITLCRASTYINRENNVVCFLVAHVLNELKTTLYNPDHVYTSTTGLNIEELMTDLMVASFRINYRNNQHFEICFNPDSNAVYQIVLVKAIYQIVNERPLAWWPTVIVLYNRSAQIRNMFERCIRKVTSHDHQSLSTKSSLHRSATNRVSSMSVIRKKEETRSVESDQELLFWLVKLFHADPQIALSNPDKCAAEIQRSSLQILNGLVILMMFTTTLKLTLQVSETLLSLHSPKNIELWNPEAPMATFWEISSQIVFNVTDRLLSDKEPPDKAMKAMRWLQKVLKCRIQFIEANQTCALIGTHNSICSEALSKLEIVFLLCLWNTDTNRVQLAMKCFGLLCQEALLLSVDRPSPIHPSTLTAVYYKFANEVKQTGRTALHKKILSILRDVQTQTVGNIKAWELTHSRWQSLTVTLTNYPKDDTSLVDSTSSTIRTRTLSTGDPEKALDDILSEWSKMSGYLCSLGGIFLSKEKDFTLQKSPTKALENNQVHRFLSEMLTLLVCSNERTSIKIRNAVKEALGTDLSISLYPSFFSICNTTTNCFIDQNSQVKINNDNTIYAENLIYIIRTILESKNDNIVPVLLTMPVEDIITAILKYIRSLTVSLQSLVVKSKMCQLVEAMMLRKIDLSFRQEMRFRNRLVEYLTDWVLYGTDKSKNMTPELQAISCTLDEAAMRAVAALLKSLPLQPDRVEQDITEAKYELFLKHFTLFMKILNNCYDNDTSMKMNRKGVLSPHFANLRSSTVRAMSNMLSANIDSGLMHSISLGYHEDAQTRATFLEVLTDILKQGTEFENLAETVLEDRLEQIVRLVTNNGHQEEIPIVMALCNSVVSDDMDEVAKVLVNLFDMNDNLHVLLLNLFKDEVNKAESQQTLFRGNTIASKAMSYSFKIYGLTYLQLLLGPVVHEMIKNKDTKCYEVDAARLENGESVGDNTQSVIELANLFMDRVKELKEDFPLQLRSLCYCLNQAVQVRFPSTAYDAVSSAVFLRFINPAMVSPDSHGIVNEPLPKSVRRGLMLLSKILQNLANHLSFSKEAHMEIFNGFLENNFYRLHSFFRDVSVKPEVLPSGSLERVDLSTDCNIADLHKLLWNAQEAMGRHMMMRGVTLRDLFEKLVTLLAHLGPPENQPVKITQRVTRERKTGVAYKLEDFMANHRGHNEDEVERIRSSQLFYTDGKSKAGRPVFYYIARRYIKDEVSEEVLLYYICLSIQHLYDKPWELVVDFSHTSLANCFQIKTLGRAADLLSNQLKNLHATYIYNVNNSVKKYLDMNQHERIMKSLKNNSSIVIVDQLSKLQEFIESVKLPHSTVVLEKDVKNFSVLKINMKGSVNIKVNPAGVQLQTPEKIKVLGFALHINDVFYASQVQRATNAEEILYLQVSSRDVLKFYAPEAEEIANQINHIVSRWKLSQPDKKTSTEARKMRPKDVPGTLLNMSLINLGNRNPSLRLAAYNLLCSLTATFNLQVNERLLEANGVCIPGNCTLFIHSISEQLATKEPDLTLEFLDECISCYSKCDDESRNLCLTYMAPWLPNLSKYSSFPKEDPSKLKMIDIISKLIDLTIANRSNYPFIQAQIWANIGKLPDLLDVVIELFIKTSSTGGFMSEKAEVMADTTVTLASANTPLVSNKIFERFHKLMERTALSATVCLEEHLTWDDIAILARYLLMLSFNDSLGVSEHLADIFHIVTLLVSTGPDTLRATLHGLVINSLQSILTCSNMKLSNETQLLIRTKIEDFSLPKFYLLFVQSQNKDDIIVDDIIIFYAHFTWDEKIPTRWEGISSVKSVPAKVFESTLPQQKSRAFTHKLKQEQRSVLSLAGLEIITNALIDVLQACLTDLEDDSLLKKWQSLCLQHCIKHNMAIQSRCVVVYGCIKKDVTDEHVKQLLKVLSKACSVHLDYSLIESVMMCLAKFQLVLPKTSEYHKVLFWVAVGILQFGAQNLYPPALSLLENNLNVCHQFRMFDSKKISEEMMGYRDNRQFHWIFKQLDHMSGLSFFSDFHFALTALLVKGIRHPSSKTKSTSLRIVNTLISICTRRTKIISKDTFDVNENTLPYLAALMPGSEEIRLKLYNEQPVYSALTMKRRKSKIFNEPRQPGYRKQSLISHQENSTAEESEHVLRRKILFESSKYNSLLNPALLETENRQSLLFVLLATLVDHTVDDFEAKTLFEVLAEASILYPDSFPICFSILNRKMQNVLSHSEDTVTLTSAQTIVQSTSSVSTLTKSRPKLQKLTNIGFHGLHSFPGPFNEASDRAEVPQMFARYLDLVTNRKSAMLATGSSSGQLFTTDDVTITSCTSTHSLNAIIEQPPTQAQSNFSAFKRVGSYSPLRRARKDEAFSKSESMKKSSNFLNI